MDHYTKISKAVCYNNNKEIQILIFNTTVFRIQFNQNLKKTTINFNLKQISHEVFSFVCRIVVKKSKKKPYMYMYISSGTGGNNKYTLSGIKNMEI